MKKNIYLSSLILLSALSLRAGSFAKPSTKKLKEEYAQQLVEVIRAIPEKQAELAEEQATLIKEQYALAQKHAELIKELEKIMNDETTYSRTQLAQLTEQTKNFNTRLAQLNIHQPSKACGMHAQNGKKTSAKIAG